MASFWCWQTPGAFSFLQRGRGANQAWETLWLSGEEKVTLRQLNLELVCTGWYMCTCVFIEYYIRGNETWRWNSILASHPISPPTRLHSPYLLPLFTWRPSCSNLMRTQLMPNLYFVTRWCCSPKITDIFGRFFANTTVLRQIINMTWCCWDSSSSSVMAVGNWARHVNWFWIPLSSA